MSLIEKTKSSVETKNETSKEFQANIIKVIKNIEEIVKILQNNGLTNCLIRPPEMDKFGPFISSIFIDLNGYTIFQWIEWDDDDFEDMNNPINLPDLSSFLKKAEFNEVKEISSILADENSTFEIN